MKWNRVIQTLFYNHVHFFIQTENPQFYSSTAQQRQLNSMAARYAKCKSSTTTNPCFLWVDCPWVCYRWSQPVNQLVPIHIHTHVYIKHYTTASFFVLLRKWRVDSISDKKAAAAKVTNQHKFDSIFRIGGVKWHTRTARFQYSDNTHNK